MLNQRAVWTAEHDQIITEYRGGLSSEQIAAKINMLFGGSITRNAVIGRAHRLNLPNIKPVAPPRVPKAPRIAGERKERKAALKVFVSPPIPVEPLNILFGDLQPHHCREIVGQDAWESLSCGHDKHMFVNRMGAPAMSSYCRWHHAINYMPARR